MSLTREYQVAVVGGGPGGYVAALRCAQLGLKTVCIEASKTLGGTCLNVGCIPSKTLLHSSEMYQQLRHFKDLGIKVDNSMMDFDALMHDKQNVIDGLAQGVAGLLKKNRVDHIRGKAHFIDPHQLHIAQEAGASRRITADAIILATGSEPISLPNTPFDESKILSSTGALSLKQIPVTMIVVGAGAIGVELASVYSRLGTKVTIVEMLDHICPAQDSLLSKELQKILEKQGITFYLETALTSVEAKEHSVVVHMRHAKDEERIQEAEALLVCVGRRPYSAGLALEAAELATDAKGFLPVDGNFRSKQPHIYAIGDLITGPGLAHRASEEGIAVAQLIAGQKAQVNYMAIPNVIYTAPELAAVGMTEAVAVESGRAIDVGIAYFRGNARARCSHYTDGLVKIIADKKTGRLLGMHILGVQASELIATGALSMAWGATVEALGNATYAHPTLAETIKEAALHALGRPLHG
jgi:dihydrolipoamide dehydrogenase